MLVVLLARLLAPSRPCAMDVMCTGAGAGLWLVADVCVADESASTTSASVAVVSDPPAPRTRMENREDREEPKSRNGAYVTYDSYVRGTEVRPSGAAPACPPIPRAFACAYADAYA